MTYLFKKNLFNNSLFNNSIKTRIALIVSLFVFVTAILVGLVFYIGGNNYIVEKELETLEHHLKEQGLLLSAHLQAPREDVLFLASTPPIKGIIRATQLNGEIDPFDGSSKNQWLSRLAIIFEEMLVAKPAYLQIRFIGKEKELVRVENLNGISFIVPEKSLRNKYENTHFAETAKLKEREIYMSDIELYREFGELALPYLPVIRISTPIFDSQGILFGIVVVNMDFTFVLTQVSGIGDLRNEIRAGRSEFYVTSDKGDFLVHPDNKKSFGFEFGNRHLIQNQYPVYRDLIELNSANKKNSYSEDGQAIFEANGIEKVAYFHKSYFDPTFPQRFLGMAIVVNYDDVVSGSYAIRNKSILLVTLLITVATIFAVLFARMITGNLMRITNAAEEFANGKREFDLPIDSRDEVGVLARTLQKMMDQVQLRDEELRQSEARFSGIIELADEGIISLDEEQRIILFNTGAETIFGYKKEEVIGKSIDFLLPEAVRGKHKCYVEGFAASKHSSRTMRNRGGLFGVRKNGKPFQVEASISNLLVNDKKIFTAVVRDVSEQVRAQEALLTVKRNLSEAQHIAKMGSYLWTLDSGAMEWSDEFFQILDYEKGVHVSMLNKITDRVHEEDQSLFDEALEKVFASDKSVDTRFRIMLPSGSIRSIIMSFRLRDKDKNSVRKVAGTIQDVTDQINTVEEKQALKNQLQQSQKMDAIGQLTGGIAHDFNNILAAIMGYTNLAQERFAQDNPVLEGYLDEVYRAGERATDLISQMLAFSRGGSNEPKILAIQPLVEEALSMLKSTIPSSISVTTDYEKDLPKIMMDPVQVYQLVMNLCINARDAMCGHGELDITLRSVNFIDAETCCSGCQNQIQGNFLELQIKDSGDGIDPEIIERVFEPFFSTKDIGKGTGMGLSMVHGIVHEHGGHIILNSKLGEGTVFQLYFPGADYIEKNANNGHATVSEKTRVLQNKSDGDPQHILVVDDESSVAGFLRELFETRGYKVTVEIDSVKALNIFKNDPGMFDLVITDQTMPKLTGAELSKEILSMRSDMPIVLCTGYSEVIDESEAFKIGINEYLTKPIDPVKLCNAVSRLSSHTKSVI